GASAGTTYYFRVVASNAVGDSASSNTTTVTTPAPPAAPSDLAATAASASQIDPACADNASNEAQLKLERSADNVHWTDLAEDGADVPAYTWWGASAGTTYSFRVRASNAVGDSAYSNTASATTAPPAAPSNLTAAATSSSQIDLTWTNNAS